MRLDLETSYRRWVIGQVLLECSFVHFVVVHCDGVEGPGAQKWSGEALFVSKAVRLEVNSNASSLSTHGNNMRCKQLERSGIHRCCRCSGG